MNTVDQLMDLDPLTLTAQDIEAIVAYHRNARANAEAGIKVKKENPWPKTKGPISLESLGLTKPKEVVKINRRV